MKLQDVSIEILGQLIEMTEQFSREEYTKSLDLLIGQFGWAPFTAHPRILRPGRAGR
jgi:hypothetical protein